MAIMATLTHKARIYYILNHLFKKAKAVNDAINKKRKKNSTVEMGKCKTKQ